MLQIRNERVSELATRLAELQRVTKTDAVLRALEHELARVEATKTLAERVQPILDRLDKWPRTGLKADKAFFDELSGDL